MQRVVHLIVVLTVSALSWAQTAIPPSTFPDFSGTSTGVSSTLTAPSSPSSVSGSVSMSASVSGNASTTNSAQYPSLTGYSPCVSNCLAMAISSANCSSVVEVNCFCPSNRFPPSLVSCISSSCSSELTSAEDLAQRFCNLSNVTTTLAFPSPSPTPPSSSRTTPSTSGSSTSASSANTASSTTGDSTPSAAQTNDASVILTVLGIVLGILLVH